jgi:hypothetical protein
MTAAELRLMLKENADVLSEPWQEEIEATENLGAFVFTPDDYADADTLFDMPINYVPIEEVKENFREMGLAGDPAPDELIDTVVDHDTEFLIVLFEEVHGEEAWRVDMFGVDRPDE